MVAAFLKRGIRPMMSARPSRSTSSRRGLGSPARGPPRVARVRVAIAAYSRISGGAAMRRGGARRPRAPGGAGGGGGRGRAPGPGPAAPPLDGEQQPKRRAAAAGQDGEVRPEILREVGDVGQDRDGWGSRGGKDPAAAP